MEEYKALSQIIYGGIYRGIGLVFALLLGVYFVYEIWTIVLVLLLALLFAIVLSGPVNYLARRGLPKALSVLGVLGCLVLALWLASVTVVPVIQEQAEQFISDFPALLDEAQGLIASLGGTDLRSLLERGKRPSLATSPSQDVPRCRAHHEHEQHPLHPARQPATGDRFDPPGSRCSRGWRRNGGRCGGRLMNLIA